MVRAKVKIVRPKVKCIKKKVEPIKKTINDVKWKTIGSLKNSEVFRQCIVSSTRTKKRNFLLRVWR